MNDDSVGVARRGYDGWLATASEALYADLLGPSGEHDLDGLCIWHRAATPIGAVGFPS
jgi:hypothetical protein